jgi:hypothetical protein
MVRAKSAFGELQLAQHNGAARPQSANHRRIAIGAIVLVDEHAGSGRNALGMTEVLYRNWNAMQGTTKRATQNLSIGITSLGQRQIGVSVA